MPTTRHRVQVMLDQEHFETIRDLAKATRLSMSCICADVIGEAAPLLARSVQMVQDASRLTSESMAQLRLDIAKEERVLQRAAGQAFGALAGAEAAIRKAAGRAPGGRAAGARGRLAAPKPRRQSPR
jgi:hypothetical protein